MHKPATTLTTLTVVDRAAIWDCLAVAALALVFSLVLGALSIWAAMNGAETSAFFGSFSVLAAAVSYVAGHRAHQLHR